MSQDGGETVLEMPAVTPTTTTTSTSKPGSRAGSIRKRLSFVGRSHSRRPSLSSKSIISTTETTLSVTPSGTGSSDKASTTTAATSAESLVTSADSRHRIPENTWTDRDPSSDVFKALEGELSRFCSKSGVHKANVLRLALIPFLRQSLAPLPPRLNPRAHSSRIKILQKWWVSILGALRDKAHPVSGSDRSAYLEAVSGIVARPEWTASCGGASTTTRYVYESLLFDTVKLTIAKLSLKNVPLSVAAFSGKILAYAFFWAPGVAPVLLHLLKVPQEDINRIIEVSLPPHSSSDGSDAMSLDDAVNAVRDYFPVHLSRLVGFRTGNTVPGAVATPKPPPQLPDMYGPWVSRWASSNSDVFYAFLKHYYSIISQLLPESIHTNWSTHLAAPGLIIFQSFLIGGLDYLVHPQRAPDAKVIENNYNTRAISPVPASMGRRRVDRLKLLVFVREVLHNDDSCVPFYGSYCHQFENLLRAVTLHTRVHDVESCIVLADLIEEYLSSLILDHSLTRHRVQIQKDDVVNWRFWIRVVERMMSSENSHAELRALALLFNMWEHIPIGRGAVSVLPADDDLESYLQNAEGLRWGCTCWLLSNKMWRRYFCHWQPLVRSYYHRLVCWRVASVGSESDLLSSILFSNYNTDARLLLKERLVESMQRAQNLQKKSILAGRPAPLVIASTPAIHRKLAIVLNPAATDNSVAVGSGAATPAAMSPIGSPRVDQLGMISPDGPPAAGPASSLRRTNTFDVFDDVAYSYPTSMPPSELFPTDVGTSRNSLETVRQPRGDTVGGDKGSSGALENLGNSIKKKWSKLTGGSSSTPNLRRYFSNSSIAPQRTATATGSGRSVSSNRGSMYNSRSPSGSLSTGSSPSSFTPVSGASSTSTPPSPRSVKSFENLNGKSSGQKKLRKPLTIDLIPPPPQLLRKIPEITRPPYKFGLVFCERSFLKHQEPLHKPTSKFQPHDDPIVDIDSPRLPFEEEDEGEFDFAADVPVGKYNHVVELQNWKYCARSLSEWKAAVVEFEEFVRNRKRYGVNRIEDLGVPFMVAEIPAKIKA